MNYAKWIGEDHAQDKDAGGAYVPNTVTLAQIETFADAIQALSDASIYKVTSTGKVDISPAVAPVATGTTIEHRGNVTIQHLTNEAERYTISVPALKLSAVDANGTAVHKMTAASEQAILTAFCAMCGYTAADYRVTRSSVFYSKK